MGTFNSTGTGGSWTDDSTWAETGQPAADGTDYVVITAGDVVTLPGNTGTGAISIQGEITGNGHTLTLNGSGDSPLVNFDGTITATSTLDLTITADENNTIDCLGTGTFNNVIINNSGYTTTLSHTLTCASLTITAGTLDTGSDKTLTVSGATDVAGTLTLNGSTCSFGDGGYTGHYGLRATGASGVITADADSTVAMSSLYAADNAGINIALSGTNTINKYRASNNMMIRLTNNTVDSDMTLTVTTTEADKLMQVADANVTLILNASSGTPARKIADSAMSLKALTITNGTLDTDSSNDYALTVGTLGAAGQTGVIVDGTLTLNGSTCILTNLAGTGILNAPTTTITIRDRAEAGTYAGKAIDVDNMTVNNDLNIELTSGKAQDLDLGDDKVHDLTINNDTDARQNYMVQSGSIDGDLTITRGILNTFNRVLTVDGNCSIAADGKLEANVNGNVAVNLGSLTIASGGEYDATSATTTITSKNGDNAISQSGTFIHNDGIVLVTTPANCNIVWSAASQRMHELQVNLGNTARTCSVTGQFDSHRYVESDLTVTNCKLYANGATFKIAGDVSLATNATLEIGASNTNAEFGSLTIDSGTTYSASSGTTTISGNFLNLGTFTHNSGTVLFNQAGNNTINNNDAANDTVFYNVTSSPGGRTRFYNSCTIANALSHTSGTALQLDGGRNITLTMGTSTSAGSISITAGEFFRIYPSATTNTIAAANSLFPCVVTGADWSWSDGAGTINLSGLDFQYNITTGTNGSDNGTIILTGDCEFDAVTVSGGDTLDLNEQRVNFGGYNQVVNDGTIDATNALIYLAYFGGTATFTNDANTKVVYQNCDGSRGSWRFAQNTSGVSMLNDGRNHDLAHDTTIGKLIVGNTSATGFGLSTGGNEKDLTVTDLTIVTGGKLVDDGLATGSVITCSGDLTTSGGLIGKSGLLFDGTNDYMRAGTYGVANNFTGWSDNNLTVEVWAKSSDSSQAGIMASRWGAGGSRQFILYQEANGSVRAAINSDGGSTYITTNGAEAGVSNSWTDGRDGRWHHYAMTYDGANLKLYIDGQLYANRATAVTLVNGVNSIFGIGAYNTNSSNTFSASGGFIGDIHRCSVWNHTLTESEIRGMMFYDYATMDADSDFNTPKGDLKGWYQFDEGKDSTIDNMQGTDNVDGLRTGATWAGAGTFTQGTSTVDLTGTGALTYQGEIDFNILKTAAATKTTTVQRLSSGDININTNLYKGAGTLTTGSSIGWRLSRKTGVGDVNNSGLVVSGASYPVDLSSSYIVYYHDATIAKEVKWQFFINGSDTTFAANQEATGYWHNAAFQTDVGDYNLKCTYMRYSDAEAGKFTMGSGDLWLTNNGNGVQTTYPSNTFTVGPGATVSGSTAGTNFKSQNNFVVVGKIENFDVVNEELKVTGQVINCTGDIHQYFPTIDHSQQLDADTADDRDVRLGRDLDKNTELINS